MSTQEMPESLKNEDISTVEAPLTLEARAAREAVLEQAVREERAARIVSIDELRSDYAVTLKNMEELSREVAARDAEILVLRSAVSSRKHDIARAAKAMANYGARYVYDELGCLAFEVMMAQAEAAMHAGKLSVEARETLKLELCSELSAELEAERATRGRLLAPLVDIHDYSQPFEDTIKQLVEDRDAQSQRISELREQLHAAEVELHQAGASLVQEGGGLTNIAKTIAVYAMRATGELTKRNHELEALRQTARPEILAELRVLRRREQELMTERDIALSAAQEQRAAADAHAKEVSILAERFRAVQAEFEPNNASRKLLDGVIMLFDTKELDGDVRISREAKQQLSKLIKAAKASIKSESKPGSES